MHCATAPNKIAEKGLDFWLSGQICEIWSLLLSISFFGYSNLDLEIDAV